MSRIRLALFAAVVALAGSAGTAAADGNVFRGPFSSLQPYPKHYTVLGHSTSKAPLPAFQAAPWYLYWPYDGHFQTPAPIGGAFYGAPAPGNFPVNPYFPQPGYGYGPLPGGVNPYYAPTGPAPVGPSLNPQ